METFPRYWPIVWGIHRSLVNSPHKGQWRGALVFSLICVWINGWVNNHEARDLRRYRAHYDVNVMCKELLKSRCVAIRMQNRVLGVLVKNHYCCCLNIVSKAFVPCSDRNLAVNDPSPPGFTFSISIKLQNKIIWYQAFDLPGRRPYLLFILQCVNSGVLILIIWDNVRYP